VIGVERVCVLGFLPTMKSPTIAVAVDCWFWARQQLTRPFLCVPAVMAKHLVFLVEPYS